MFGDIFLFAMVWYVVMEKNEDIGPVVQVKRDI